LKPTNAEDCDRRIREIYGTDLVGVQGVIHVTSVWAESARSLVTLRIRRDTPQSETDTFVLNLARARSDAIVTTGKTLREEPQVRHDLQGPDSWPEALSEWRKERLGKTASPLSVILTSGRDIDFEHPLFHCWTTPLVFTSEESAGKLAEQAGSSVEIVGRPQPSLRDAISYLRDIRGLETIVIEAGPSTSRDLYQPPVALDELMLSVYQEPRLPPPLRGARFLSPQDVGIVFPAAGSSYSLQDESGRWSFYRYRR
jgi:riboflavin biosynthesis pyrimidine reductase